VLDQITDEMLTIAIVVMGSLTAIVVFTYAAIFIDPQIAINPFPPPRLTPTVQQATVAATFPPTWTPAPTTTSTPTTSPTPTRTVPPYSTLAPLPMSTPVSPVARVSPSPTQVQPPSAPTFPPVPPPPPPAPTATPVPLYVRQQMLGGADCNWVGVYGFVHNASGQAMSGVTVRVHNDFGYTRDVTTGGDGRWEVFLDNHPRDDLATGLWHAAVIEGGQNASDEVAFALSTNCTNGIQRVQIDWQRTQ